MTGGAGPAVDGLLRAQLADPACTWSLGAYGAGAAFAREPDEPAWPLGDGATGLVTLRGALAIRAHPDLRPFAYETGFDGGWSQAVALCLPEAACAMGRRTVLTELGPDVAAVRPEDRAALVFDLGLGLRAADACLRTADPERIGRLRAAAGRPLLATGDGAMPPAIVSGLDQVVVTRIGRVEVFAPEADRAAAGPVPRTHVLTQILRLGRTHAATAPIPRGWVPCGTLHPAHPARDGAGQPTPFDAGRHAAFGRVLDRWGDPALVALRRAVLDGQDPDPSRAGGRYARLAIRAARAQLRASGG
ncbi:hypothetical protein R1A27_05680 [Methylobacterium sp. NMS12]|uniref:DUF6925 family protein n=1 Tax=Methylobacterium sp. NMS12 TaxID=3079766 RepID=UPI003F8844F3